MKKFLKRRANYRILTLGIYFSTGGLLFGFTNDPTNIVKIVLIISAITYLGCLNFILRSLASLQKNDD